MRLGVVITGTGVYGAAGAGVLCELWRREMEPYAVCALGSGAWPAALFASGLGSAQMEDACIQAQRMGKRLLRRQRFGGRRMALYHPRGMQHLLQAQTGGRILALCPRRAIFPLMSQRAGLVTFASASCVPGDGFMPVTQVSAAFAARAAMGLPPFLSPVSHMGSLLLPACDTTVAAKLLFSAGAQRVLIAVPRPSVQADADALLLASACIQREQTTKLPGTATLSVQMPQGISSLSFGEITTCMELGKRAALRELDALLSGMGMAYCRVLPFRR